MKIKISETAFSTGVAQVLESLPYETGGILFGWWESDRTAVVHSLLPVRDPKAGGHHYNRSHSQAQETLEVHQLAHGDDRCGYIGEWHSHPVPQPPSSIDRKALSEIAREARVPIALVVLAVDFEDRIVPYGLIGMPRRLRRVSIESIPVRRTVE